METSTIALRLLATGLAMVGLVALMFGLQRLRLLRASRVAPKRAPKRNAKDAALLPGYARPDEETARMSLPFVTDAFDGTKTTIHAAPKLAREITESMTASMAPAIAVDQVDAFENERTTYYDAPQQTMQLDDELLEQLRVSDADNLAIPGDVTLRVQISTLGESASAPMTRPRGGGRAASS